MADRELQVHKSTIALWLNLYQTEGPTAFLEKEQNNHYTRETMIAAVLEYQANLTLAKEKGYPIEALCELLHVTRSAYYRWLKNPKIANEKRNQKIAEKVKQIHKEHPDMRYRRIRDELEVNHGIDVNDKRILRINRKLQMRSTIKYGPSSCIKHAKDLATFLATKF